MNRLIFLPLLIWIACDSPTKSEDGESNSNPIIFADLQVGQSSSYVSFAISGYWSQEQTFEYTYDSLIITITADTGDGYLVTERFVDVDPTDWWVGNDTLSYMLQVTSDTLRYQQINSSYPYSRIFAWYGPPDLPLAPVTELEVTLDGWQPVFPSGDCCQGVLDNLDVLDQTYGPLNVKFNDMTPVDGPADWWLYSGADGLVRHMSINAWTGTGKGWDLLP